MLLLAELVAVAHIAAHHKVVGHAPVTELGIGAGTLHQIGEGGEQLVVDLGIAAVLILLHDEIHHMLRTVKPRVIGVIEHLHAAHILHAHPGDVVGGGREEIDKYLHILPRGRGYRLLQSVDPEGGDAHACQQRHSIGRSFLLLLLGDIHRFFGRHILAGSLDCNLVKSALHRVGRLLRRKGHDRQHQ